VVVNYSKGDSSTALWKRLIDLSLNRNAMTYVIVCEQIILFNVVRVYRTTTLNHDYSVFFFIHNIILRDIWYLEVPITDENLVLKTSIFKLSHVKDKKKCTMHT